MHFEHRLTEPWRRPAEFRGDCPKGRGRLRVVQWGMRVVRRRSWQALIAVRGIVLWTACRGVFVQRRRDQGCRVHFRPARPVKRLRSARLRLVRRRLFGTDIRNSRRRRIRFVNRRINLARALLANRRRRFVEGKVALRGLMSFVRVDLRRLDGFADSRAD